MKTKYDKKEDLKYIYIKKGKVHRTEQLESWLYFDYDVKGNVIGVEILDASAHPLSLMVSGDQLLSIGEVVEFNSHNTPDGVIGADVGEKSVYPLENLWVESVK
jgi:uncharacterized protein YuzE